MSEGVTSDERTILDYLNEDCWRAVLDYVPLEDMVRTERTSQKWQDTMLTYLRGVRIDLKTPRFWRPLLPQQLLNKTKVRGVRLVGAPSLSFERWTNKLGPSVMSAYCDSEDCFQMFGNCPNLENLTLINLSEKFLRSIHNENFKWLKRLCFKNCYFVSDRCVNQFMVNNTLEELEIQRNFEVTGQFLTFKNPIKLKSLKFNVCRALRTADFLAASDHLSELIKIELTGVDVSKDIHLILDKIPKLEHVTVKDRCAMSENSILFMTICRLKHLKYLCLDLYASDTDIEAVTRSCPQLRSLRLNSCIGVTGRGLAMACAHAGARLVELAVSGSPYLTNDHVVACIRACPKLKVLVMRECHGLTCELLLRAVSARRELGVHQPLKLECGGGVWRVPYYDELGIPRWEPVRGSDPQQE